MCRSSRSCRRTFLTICRFMESRCSADTKGLDAGVDAGAADGGGGAREEAGDGVGDGGARARGRARGGGRAEGARVALVVDELDLAAEREGVDAAEPVVDDGEVPQPAAEERHRDRSEVRRVRVDLGIGALRPAAKEDEAVRGRRGRRERVERAEGVAEARGVRVVEDGRERERERGGQRAAGRVGSRPAVDKEDGRARALLGEDVAERDAQAHGPRDVRRDPRPRDPAPPRVAPPRERPCLLPRRARYERHKCGRLCE